MLRELSQRMHFSLMVLFITYRYTPHCAHAAERWNASSCSLPQSSLNEIVSLAISALIYSAARIP